MINSEGYIKSDLLFKSKLIRGDTSNKNRVLIHCLNKIV